MDLLGLVLLSLLSKSYQSAMWRWYPHSKSSGEINKTHSIDINPILARRTLDKISDHFKTTAVVKEPPKLIEKEPITVEQKRLKEKFVVFPKYFALVQALDAYSNKETFPDLIGSEVMVENRPVHVIKHGVMDSRQIDDILEAIGREEDYEDEKRHKTAKGETIFKINEQFRPSNRDEEIIPKKTGVQKEALAVIEKPNFDSDKTNSKLENAVQIITEDDLIDESLQLDTFNEENNKKNKSSNSAITAKARKNHENILDIHWQK